jgi:hypothetical protein
MTESEWLACADPTLMLEHLRTDRTTSERKLRLFAVASCQRIRNWLGERSLAALDILQRYLNDETNAEELHIAVGLAEADWIEEFGYHHPSNAVANALTFGNVASLDAVAGAAAQVAKAVRAEATISKGIALQGWPPPKVIDPFVEQACVKAGRDAMSAELVAQCHLIREIFHGPRRAVFFRSLWRTNSVLDLAAAMYDEQNFDMLPKLAAALRDNGCTDADVLDHCRSEGPHVRGCWVIDLLLGKHEFSRLTGGATEHSPATTEGLRI